MRNLLLALFLERKDFLIRGSQAKLFGYNLYCIKKEMKSLRFLSCDTICISRHQFWVFDYDLHHWVLQEFYRSYFKFSTLCSRLLFLTESESGNLKTILSFLELGLLIPFVHFSNHLKFLGWKFHKISFRLLPTNNQTAEAGPRSWCDLSRATS